MKTQHWILAIDQGGQSSRVAIYRHSGELLHCFAASCATTHVRVNGAEHIEQNPNEIMSGIASCLTQIETALGDDVKNIKAAGFAGQGSSLVCWNSQTGEALSPVISWQDIRGEYYLKNISLTHEQARQITGLRVSPHYGASKIRWCLEHNQGVIDAQKNNQLSIGPIVSWLFHNLLNKPPLENMDSRVRGYDENIAESSPLQTRTSTLVDPGHAQRTLLWNLKTNNWDEHLLKLFNIPKAIMPECKCHNSYFGRLNIGNHAIPFIASARDQGASLFARGMPDKTACYVNIGTGAFIQKISDKLSAPEGLLISPLWIPQKNTMPSETIELASAPCYLAEMSENYGEPKGMPSLYAWEATVNGAASATEFIQQQTGLQLTPDEIALALATEPDRQCYFLNAIGGLSAPYWRTDLSSRFSEHLTPQEKVLAWLESIIFQIAINITLMDREKDLQKIYISGGLSNATALCEKLADLTALPVIRSNNADATLQGIANMTAGLSPNWKPQTEDEIFHPKYCASLSRRFKTWEDEMGKWLDKKR